MRQSCIVILCGIFFSLSCAGKTGTGDSGVLPFLLASRSYYMGLTPFPYDISGMDKIEYVYSKIRTDADLMAHHFDNGIPWDDALTDTYPYTTKIMEDWDFRKSRTPAGHKLYVAITPINSMRDGLAPVWNATGDNQPLTAPWSGYAFDNADVKTAYLNYCRRVIEYFNPDYIAVGVEVNLVMEKMGADDWNAYVSLQQDVYATLKAEYPSLPIFVTLTGIDLVEGYSGADHTEQMNALSDIIDYTDYYAISLHPFFAEVSGGTLPADMFDRIFALSAKPACITETSFPAEELTMTDYEPDITLAGSAEKQRVYFNLLLDEAQEHDLLFVVNFLVRDYDVLWSTPVPGGLGSPEDILKAWRDTGFYDQDGIARPVLDEWKARLTLPVR